MSDLTRLDPYAELRRLAAQAGVKLDLPVEPDEDDDRVAVSEPPQR